MVTRPELWKLEFVALVARVSPLITCQSYFHWFSAYPKLLANVDHCFVYTPSSEKTAILSDVSPRIIFHIADGLHCEPGSFRQCQHVSMVHYWMRGN